MKIKTIGLAQYAKLAIIALSFGFLAVASMPAQAATQPTSSGSNTNTRQQAQTEINLEDSIKQNPITKDLQLAVNIMAGAVGVIVVIMLLTGGVQYIAAGDKAEAVAKARKRMTNAVFALFAFFFMYAFLQWLIPGGIF